LSAKLTIPAAALPAAFSIREQPSIISLRNKTTS
jgi:hypothetical protein